MALIRIQESSEQAGTFYAKVSFDQGPAYDITIRDPFSKAEEERLEWYFDEHLKFPFTDQVKAQEAAASISLYGEKLFEQVFVAAPLILSTYRTAVQAGLDMIQIEVSGQPPFHALHWEALKDHAFPQPLALRVTILRKNLSQQAVYTNMHPSPTINLMIVTARPRGKRDMGYRTVSRPLVEALRKAEVPVQVDILRPGTYKALENHLHETASKHGFGYYHVIHFDVHGSLLTDQEFRVMNRSMRTQRSGRQDIQPYEGLKAFLALEGEQDGTADLVEAEELATLLIRHQVPITILNACQSGKQIGEHETSLGSYLMQAGIQMVVAMGYTVTVSATELLMRTLYRQLFAKDDLAAGIRHGRTALYNHKSRRAYFDQMIDLEDWMLPVVYQNQPVQLKPRDFTPEERSAYNKRKLAEKQYAPPEPQYGFVGRDLDILQIEKRLLAKRNLLLMRGMGGAGKTTLLKHLRAWWHTTGFVQQTYYFGYDERAWTLQQILTDIAQQLYGPKYYTDIQPYPLDEQQLMIAERLRAEPHLLILDNLESITGAHLAIQHTLPKLGQDALRSFLADLAKGRTLVLLGSRGGEDWLARGTFDDNIYDLPGLDAEAASTLADRILERNGALQYRDDENLRKLIKLLDGFPLAMEVVLANLRQQTPDELLEALQAGDVRLDTPASQQKGKDIFEQKTESILRCIDYSHSNLSPDAQQLLRCLAPFTSVIDLGWIKQYTTHLKEQPSLATLSFERWPEVIQEAVNWGLLSPDRDIPRFLHLQPTLSYFLRNRLNAPEQAEVRSAVETAFRELYDQVGNELYQLFNSKKPRERQKGQVLTSLEYENLVTALNLALAARISISSTYFTLSKYLDATHDQRRGLELGQTVLGRLEMYPADKLAGSLSAEFVGVICDIARRQLNLKEYAAANASYQKALSHLLENKHLDADTIKKRSASIYHELGKVAEEQRQWTQAEQYYQQALRLFIEYNDREAQAMTYHNLGYVAQEQRQWTQAEQYYQQALQIKREDNHRYEQAATYHNLGYVAQEQRQWTQAEQYYQQALQVYGEYNDRYHQAETYHNLGMVAGEQRQWTQARKHFLTAVEIDVEYNDRYAQADIYHELGWTARKQRQWTQAEQYYQQALQIYVEYNDRYAQAKTCRNLGWVAQEQQDWAEAERCYRDSLALAEEQGDMAGAATTSTRLAIVASSAGRPAEAEGWIKRALELDEQVQPAGSEHARHLSILAGLLVNEVRAGHTPQTRLAEARSYAEQARAIFETLDVSSGIWADFNILASIADLEGQTEQARDYRRRAHETFAVFSGNHIARQHGQIIADIAAAARGDVPAREALEPVLPELEKHGWRIADAARRIWAGERNWHMLVEGLDNVEDALLILLVLETIASLEAKHSSHRKRWLLPCLPLFGKPFCRETRLR